MRKCLSNALLAGSLLLANIALAQDPLEVALSEVSGNPGDAVDVTFTFTGNGETSGFGGDFVFAAPDAFSSVDLSDCLAGNSSQVGTCVHPGGDETRVRILLANDEVTPLEDFTGTITFTIDESADPGVAGLVWDEESWDTGSPEADVNATSGSVEIIEPMGDPLAVSLTDESGNPGETVEVTFEFTGNGETSGFGGDFVIGNPDAFSAVDLTDCLAGNTSAVGTCVHPGGDESRVRILLANDEATPLDNFTGTIAFEIDSEAAPELVDLEWDDTSWDSGSPPADVNATSGSVEIIEPMGDPLAVSLTDESGNPGETVEVTLEFTGNGETSGFGGDFVIGNPDAFSAVDLTDCLAGNTSEVGTCVHPGGDESRVRILLANNEVTPLEDFTGTIAFTIEKAAGKGVVDLAWDNASWDTGSPPADVNGTDGSVDVVLGPQPDIGIDPTSHDFGVLEPGESDNTSVTVTNTGDGDGLEITDTGLTGDAPFAIESDTCDGATLDVGATCTIDVSFAPAGEGDFSGTLTVDSNAGAVSSELTGSSMAVPGFGSSPAGPVINLGTTAPGGELSQEVVIGNNGTEDLSVDCSPLDDPDGVFSIAPDPVVFQAIPPGESETFTVSCQVDDPGSYSATMSCATNDPANETVDYQFTCQSAPLVIPTMNWMGMALLMLLLLTLAAWRLRTP